MTKQIIILLIILKLGSLNSQDLTEEQQKFVSHFISLIKQKQKEKISDIVSYPLKRQKPLPSIKNKKEFIQLYDDIFDETLTKTISNTTPKKDWSEVGWRGITFGSGLVWLDTDGQLIAINYESKKEKTNKEKLLNILKSNLHESIRNFKEPKSIIETSKYRVRVDEQKDGSFRYCSWNIKKTMNEKPELIITGGTIEFDGSGGNHKYIFKNKEYVYEVYITILGDGGEYDANLTIYKDKKEILNQKAKQIE